MIEEDNFEEGLTSALIAAGIPVEDIICQWVSIPAPTPQTS